MDNDFIALMNELQASLLADEDLTVIVADTFENNDIIAEEKKASHRGSLYRSYSDAYGKSVSSPTKPEMEKASMATTSPFGLKV